jgi:hypothetical protein
MAIRFSDNFNSGTPTGWTSSNLLGTVDKWGYARTFATGCGNLGVSQAHKLLAFPVFNEYSHRMQVACIIPNLDPTDGIFLCAAIDHNGGIGDNNFSVLVYIKPDGSFRIRWNNNGTDLWINSAPGLYPVNGIQFGLQIRVTVATNAVIIFTVNNIDVATMNFSHVPRANQVDDFWLYVYRDGHSPLTDIVIVDNYEVDDSADAVDWPAGDAPVLDLNLTCNSAPPDPPPPSNPVLLWSQVSGPCTAVFSDDSIINPEVSFPCPGIYVLKLSASNDCGEYSSTVTITVSDACNLSIDPPFADTGL